MRYRRILVPPANVIAQVTCLSIVIGIGTIVSPFIIRSVVDGFLLTQDRSAIVFAVFVVAIFEMVSFGADYLIRNQLNNLVEKTLKLLKTQALQGLLNKRVNPDLDFFNRTWAVDIRRLVHHDMRQRWLRYKDMFLVALMSFVMMNLSTEAGFFILVVAALQFGLAAWDSRSIKNDTFSVRKSEEVEYLAIKDFLKQLPVFYDKQIVSSEIQNIQKLVDNTVAVQYLADKNRSFLWDLKAISRGFLIVGALGIAAFGGVDMSWAAGTFWALMLVVFRLTAPLSSIANWIFSERSVQVSRKRVMELLHYNSEDHFEPDVAFQQFKNTIGKALLQKNSSEKYFLKAQVMIQAENLHKFQQIARHWSSRFLWGDVQILNSPLERPTQDCSHCIYIIDSRAMSQVQMTNILTAAPSVCVLTSVVLNESDFDKNFVWNYEREKFSEVSLKEQEIMTLVTNIVRNQSVVWKEVFRDIRMYCKLQIPFEVAFLKWNVPVELEILQQHIREFDHLIMGPDGLAVALLIGSEGAGTEIVTERFNKSTKNQCHIVRKIFFRPSRDSWAQNLAMIEQEVSTTVYSSPMQVVKEAM